MRIDGAELIIYPCEGGEVTIELTNAQLKAVFRSCGISIQDVNTDEERSTYSVYSFDDDTIENVILPKLPQVNRTYYSINTTKH